MSKLTFSQYSAEQIAELFDIEPEKGDEIFTKGSLTKAQLGKIISTDKVKEFEEKGLIDFQTNKVVIGIDVQFATMNKQLALVMECFRNTQIQNTRTNDTLTAIDQNVKKLERTVENLDKDNVETKEKILSLQDVLIKQAAKVEHETFSSIIQKEIDNFSGAKSKTSNVTEAKGEGNVKQEQEKVIGTKAGSSTTEKREDNHNGAKPKQVSQEGKGNSGMAKSFIVREPKFPNYDGKDDWRAFIVLFERIASRYEVTEKIRADYLVETLRGVALKYYINLPVHTQNSYEAVKKQMSERFSQSELPPVARIKLSNIQQNVTESLEEYVDRVQSLAKDGYSSAEHSTVELIAVESFMKGCLDKGAAKLALLKEPKTLLEAAKEVKKCISHQIFLGKEKEKIRQVTFKEESNKSSSGTLEESMSYLVKSITDMNEKMERLISSKHEVKNNSNTAAKYSCFYCGSSEHFVRDCPDKKLERSRSRSPSPVRCFQCNSLGHIAKSCPNKDNVDRTASASPNRSSKNV